MATASYTDDSVGSFMSWWWQDAPATDGLYTLHARSTVGEVSTRIAIATDSAIATAAPTFNSTSQSVGWAAVDGAKSYGCEIVTGSVVESSSAASHDTTCATGTLPDGAHAARVLSFSADLPALVGDANPVPLLDTRFDVTESELGLGTSAGVASGQIRSIGGGLDFQSSSDGLAVALSIADANGAATSSAWQIAITGPGLSASNPFRATYPASQSRILIWSYDLPSRPGDYVVAATSGSVQLTSTFAIGSTSSMDRPTAVHVKAAAGGGADLDWVGATGAASYHVSAWGTGATSAVVDAWTSSTTFKVPSGTFAAGTTYDVYVAATNVDMGSVTAPLPPTVQVAENTYSPLTFTAP